MTTTTRFVPASGEKDEKPGVLLAEQAYRSLLHQMVSGQIKAGATINRRAVATQLGMSVAPVLEAMVRLEHEGLLVTHPRKATRVRLFTLDEIRDQLMLREAVECQAAWIYGGARLKANLASVLPLAQAVDESHTQKLTFWRADIALHRGLVALSQSDALVATFDRCMTLGLIAAIAHATAIGEWQGSQDHVELVNVLASADLSTAVDLIRKHLHQGKAPIL